MLLAGYKPKTALQANLIRNGLLEVKGMNHKKKRKPSTAIPDKNVPSEKTSFLSLPVSTLHNFLFF